MKQPIAIYGAGGFAREVAWLIEDINKVSPRFDIVGFIDDNPKKQGNTVNGIQVLSFEEVQKIENVQVVIGIGDPKVREQIAKKLSHVGIPSPIIVHPGVHMSSFVKIGEGAVITSGNILTVNIDIGKQVHINLDCTIGHDARIGDFSTLAPGVHVSGWVHIGKRVYIGTGAVIINGTAEKPLVIGDDAVVGAGAVVTKDVPARTTVVGVPARPLSRK